MNAEAGGAGFRPGDADRSRLAGVEGDDMMMVRIDDESRTQNDARRRVLITNQGFGCQQHLLTKGFGIWMDGGLGVRSERLESVDCGVCVCTPPHASTAPSSSTRASMPSIVSLHFSL